MDLLAAISYPNSAVFHSVDAVRGISQETDAPCCEPSALLLFRYVWKQIQDYDLTWRRRHSSMIVRYCLLLLLFAEIMTWRSASSNRPIAHPAVNSLRRVENWWNKNLQRKTEFRGEESVPVLCSLFRNPTSTSLGPSVGFRGEKPANV